jgi:transcriptional regulator with XRE-family HTH domain
MEMKLMGQKLQELRRAKGLSQFRFAVLCDVPIATLQGWEQGRRQPRLDALVKVARALGVTVDALLTAAEPEAPAAKRSPRRKRK